MITIAVGQFAAMGRPNFGLYFACQVFAFVL
jgi:hypothetical protein